MVFGIATTTESLLDAEIPDLSERGQCRFISFSTTTTQSNDHAHCRRSGPGWRNRWSISLDQTNGMQFDALPPILHYYPGNSARYQDFAIRLFAAANKPKTFYEIQGADHNDTYDVGGIEYFERLSQFIHTDS